MVFKSCGHASTTGFAAGDIYEGEEKCQIRYGNISARSITTA
jgi:hypothetical protein